MFFPGTPSALDPAMFGLTAPSFPAQTTSDALSTFAHAALAALLVPPLLCRNKGVTEHMLDISVSMAGRKVYWCYTLPAASFLRGLLALRPWLST